MWQYGEVIDSPNDLSNAVQNSLSNNNYYKKQLDHQGKFIHKENKTASDLCADYIFEKLEFGND